MATKEKTVKKLVESVMKETNQDRMKEILKDEINVKIFEIAGVMGSQRGETGPLEFTVEFGRKCFDLGMEEMERELTEKLNQ